jgi:hypothetical protein
LAKGCFPAGQTADGDFPRCYYSIVERYLHRDKLHVTANVAYCGGVENRNDGFDVWMA